ncbi:RHS repeat-associated core domain-containing protein [Cytophagaceae bacterium ABcell3]|nr:RHS repeat-associated core domain-containing protein [Cytophagaceae bacterium ABcell3]
MNRIKSSKFYTPEASTGQVNWALQANRFSTTYSYDGNGNLYHLGRHGRDNLIDNLRYEYYGEGTADAKNMLKRVTDEHDVAGNGMENDLKGSITYKYDRKGNLVAETGEHRFIDLNGDGELESHEEFVSTKLMEWDTYGKITAVYDYLENVQDNSRIRYIHYFTYDATGNRISKQEIKQENYEGAAPVIAGDGPHLENYYELIAAARGEHSPLEEVKTTYYVRDASGNVMSVYKRRIEAGEVPDTYLARFSLEEQPIYGSSRIGQHTPNKDMGEVAFTAGEFSGLSLNAMPRAARATLQNWLTASNRISEIDGQQSCACRIDRIDFGGGDVEPKGSFMGYNTNNIAVAEDYDGHLQFYTATTESYMGSENPVMLVFDRDGKLMENSYGIISSAKGKSIVMQSPERSQWYYIFTTSEQGVPYYHIVDMSAQGYGTTLGAAGRVISKNNVLDASGQYTYGRHFTFIEDRISNEGIVYAVRYRAPETADEPGLAQLVYFELRQGEMSAPVLLTGFESYDAEGAGELTLSEDGRILAYFNRKQHIAGFGYQSISIERLELEADHRTATVLSPISGTLAGTDDKGSVDFSGDGNMLYYNQHGLYIHNLTGSQSNIWVWGSSTQSALEGGAYGDVRRQGEVYIGSRDGMQLKDVLAGGITLPDGEGFGLSGYLPVQGYRIRPAGREVFTREVGRKVYELADHLGNVQVVVADMRMMTEVQTGSGTAVWEDRVAIVSSSEYYPFGMMMPGRNYNSQDYKYGFNGMEKDDELKGNGNSYDFGARIYDPRIGRWLSIDPIAGEYPFVSPYVFALNTPIQAKDPDGERVYFVIYSGGDPRYESAALTRVREIESQSDFDSSKDHVYFINLEKDSRLLKKIIHEKISHAHSNNFGLTLELSVYGHAGSDGPIMGMQHTGSDDLSLNLSRNADDKGQLTPDGWSSIKFNFDPKSSIAVFYGCNSEAFARKFLLMQKAKFSAGMSGQSGPSKSNEKHIKSWFPSEGDDIWLWDGNPIKIYKRGGNILVDYRTETENGIEELERPWRRVEGFVGEVGEVKPNVTLQKAEELDSK